MGSFDAPGVPVAVLSDSIFAGLRLESVGETVVSLYRLRRADADGAPTTEGGVSTNRGSRLRLDSVSFATVRNVP